MKKICFGLVVIALALNISNTASAKPNAKLMKDLNQLQVILTKSLIQYESRQSTFNAQMPYIRIIPGRKFQLNELRELIASLGGEPKEVDAKTVIIDEVDNIIDGMLVDAAQELGIVEISNMLIYTYEDNEMKKFAQKLRDSSSFFYMLNSPCIQAQGPCYLCGVNYCFFDMFSGVMVFKFDCFCESKNCFHQILVCSFGKSF